MNAKYTRDTEFFPLLRLLGLLIPRPSFEKHSFRNAALAEKDHFPFTKYFLRKGGIKEK
jgi:hypothetical protein